MNFSECICDDEHPSFLFDKWEKYTKVELKEGSTIEIFLHIVYPRQMAKLIKITLCSQVLVWFYIYIKKISAMRSWMQQK